MSYVLANRNGIEVSSSVKATVVGYIISGNLSKRNVAQ